MTTDKMTLFSFRRLRHLAVLALTAFAFVATSFVVVPHEVQAQERRTLLEFLFGRRKPREPVYDDVPVYEPRQPRRQQHARDQAPGGQGSGTP